MKKAILMGLATLFATPALATTPPSTTSSGTTTGSGNFQFNSSSNQSFSQFTQQSNSINTNGTLNASSGSGFIADMNLSGYSLANFQGSGVAGTTISAAACDCSDLSLTSHSYSNGNFTGTVNALGTNTATINATALNFGQSNGSMNYNVSLNLNQQTAYQTANAQNFAINGFETFSFPNQGGQTSGSQGSGGQGSGEQEDD